MDSNRTVVVAVGLFICSAAFFAVVPRFDTLVEVLRLEYFALGLAVFSALIAARDGKLPRALLFVFALAAGFGIHLGGIGITGEMPGVPFRVMWAGIVGLVAASTLGVLGGGLGWGFQRLSRSHGPNRS